MSDSSSESKKRAADSSESTPKKHRSSSSDTEVSEEPVRKPSFSNVNKSESGEISFDLGNKKKVTIKDFRNKVYIHIREFYEKDGELLPGKKGISLTLDQWQNLEGLVGTISKEAHAFQARLG